MTKSIIHPGEKRPTNKATMDQPQEEFLDDQTPPSREPEPSAPDSAAKRVPEESPPPSQARE
jgi:hypothetical protein